MVCLEANLRLNAALQYAELGWRVVPIKAGEKRPQPEIGNWVKAASCDPQIVSRWFARWPEAGVGVALGSASGIVSIDIDTDEGERKLREMASGEPPATLEYVTGKGRRLLYAIPDELESDPSTKVVTDSEGAEAFRFQGTGGQCVMPPSVHPSGRLYAWVEGRGPGEIEAAPMPLWMILEMTGAAHPPSPAWSDPQTHGPAETMPLGDDFNKRGSWDELLKAHGYTPCGVRGEVQYFTRPGKSRGVSVSLGHYKNKDGTLALHVFSGNCPGLAAGKTYDLFGVFARLEHRGDFAAAARKLADQGYGEKRKPRPVSASPPTNTSASPICTLEDEPVRAAVMILHYFRGVYNPTFRRGNGIHTADGRMVPMAEACAVPRLEIIDRLAFATDAPRYAGHNGEPGMVKTQSLPAFFKTWASTAWGELLESLPDEDNAELKSIIPAQDEFRRLVREAMLTEVQQGGKNSDGTASFEKLSLIGWCDRFAKPGPWRSIHAKQCWCKIKEIGGGEISIMVAIRHALFAQLKADRRLIDMGANTFTRRARRYGVGESTRDERPEGQSALVLDSNFVADLMSGIPGGEIAGDQQGGSIPDDQNLARTTPAMFT